MHIPPWLTSYFNREKWACKCKGAFETSGVAVFGVKDVKFSKSKPAQDMLYLEYICPKCGQKMSFEILKMDLKEFGVAILDGLDRIKEPEKKEEFEPEVPEDVENDAVEEPKKPKPKERKKLTDKSKISAEERRSVREMLDSSPNFIDFLKKIGAPIDDATENKNPSSENFHVGGEE